MRSATSDDAYAEALMLLMSAFEPAPVHELMGARYHHDHDEELKAYWYEDQPAHSELATATTAWLGPLAYWVETGRLVREYLELQAGAACNETLRQGFVAWLKRSPRQRKQYEEGDDMTRAALVDWFLRAFR